MRRGSQAASRTRVEISEPEYPSVDLASSIKSYSSRLLGVFSQSFLKSVRRAFYSGSGMYTRRSKRRLIAGSRDQGVLVAPNTSIPWPWFPTPSICTRNQVLTLLLAQFQPSLRLPAMESIQSINIIEGFSLRAMANKVLITFQDQPTQRDMISLELTEKKVPFSIYVAQALARQVFPVPGGPYSRIPFHGLRYPTKICGNLIGKITASCRAYLALSRPAISSHFTLGFYRTIAWLRLAYKDSLPSVTYCFFDATTFAFFLAVSIPFAIFSISPKQGSVRERNASLIAAPSSRIIQKKDLRADLALSQPNSIFSSFSVLNSSMPLMMRDSVSFHLLTRKSLLMMIIYIAYSQLSLKSVYFGQRRIVSYNND